MGFRFRSIFRRFCHQEQGSFAVEFAIIMPVFLLLVFGIVDFGHAWYMKQVMVNASREGARYGTRYTTDSLGNRVLPQNLTPSVPDYVTNTAAENGTGGGWGLKTLLPSNANLQVTVGGPAATETNPSVLAGEDLMVTVKARKNWLVIGTLIPSLGSYKDITVTSDMKCE